MCGIVTVIRHCDQQIGGNTSTEKCPQDIIIFIIILFAEYKEFHQKGVRISWTV